LYSDTADVDDSNRLFLSDNTFLSAMWMVGIDDSNVLWDVDDSNVLWDVDDRDVLSDDTDLDHTRSYTSTSIENTERIPREYQEN